MRHSMTSLLEVYLGNGPANRVAGSAFPRGAMTEIEAAVVITDLRGFTDLSERLAPDSLLQLLGGYFEVIVEATIDFSRGGPGTAGGLRACGSQSRACLCAG
jgi:adenylate cyclase